MSPDTDGGLLAEFVAVVDGRMCDARNPPELEASNRDPAAVRKIQLGIGFNPGDVIGDRGDIYGDGATIPGHP